MPWQILPNPHNTKLARENERRSAVAAHRRRAGADSLQDVVSRPHVVCLCGSTRFYEAFQRANFEQTMLGRIVLSVGFYAGSPEAMVREHGEGVGITPEEKVMLDELHKRKIDLADAVLVLNVGGYIGDSTRSEIEYAIAHGKPVQWLEPQAANGAHEPPRREAN